MTYKLAFQLNKQPMSDIGHWVSLTLFIMLKLIWAPAWTLICQTYSHNYKTRTINNCFLFGIGLRAVCILLWHRNICNQMPFLTTPRSARNRTQDFLLEKPMPNQFHHCHHNQYSHNQLASNYLVRYINHFTYTSRLPGILVISTNIFKF